MSETSFESVDESMAPTLNALRPDGANGTDEHAIHFTATSPSNGQGLFFPERIRF